MMPHALLYSHLLDTPVDSNCIHQLLLITGASLLFIQLVPITTHVIVVDHVGIFERDNDGCTGINATPWQPM